MDPVKNTVIYCSVWKDGQVLYTYNNGGNETDNLATLCLEMTPPYHRWYFQTVGRKIFGFLIDDGFVYFAIVNESVGNSEVLSFLQKLRDEFRRIGKRGCTRRVSGLSTLCLQEQLLPVVQHLVASLKHVSGTGTESPAENALPYQGELVSLPCNNVNGHVEGASTIALLLGKPSKQEKKMMKDNVIAMRDIEMDELRRSTEREQKIDSGPLDSNNQGTSASPLQKDLSSTRCKSSSQHLQKRWCRQVRIVLAIDAAICAVLFIIWLVVCNGTKCIR